MHLHNIHELFLKGRKLSSLAEHIRKNLFNLQANNDIDMEHNLTTWIRNIMSFEILWTGSNINNINMFASEQYQLCNQERLFLLSEIFGKLKLMINQIDKIYGPFRHKLSFHRSSTSNKIDYTHLTLMSDSSIEKDSSEVEPDGYSSDESINPMN